jgi:hypothetical protein
MYKRKVICSNPKHNGPHSHEGRILYVLGDNHVVSDNLPRHQECYDCGEARRDAEAKKKQDRLKKLFDDVTDERGRDRSS